MLHTADLAVEPDDRLRQGEHASRPQPAEFHHDPARRQQQPERRDPQPRRTWYELMTSRRLRYSYSCIQAAVSRALPKVLSLERASMMQQAAFSGSGP